MTAIPKELLEVIRSSESIAVLTGAGISAESGIPTFRDAMAGLWENFSPEDLATPEAFSKNPARVTKWYDERRCVVAKCHPNAGHVALSRIQENRRRAGQKFSLITQNVDRLHQAAGSENVLELHGTLWVWRCLACGNETEERGGAFRQYPYLCECGGNKRPGVVWFGESLPASALLEARRHVSNCSMFMSIGTSSLVFPAAGLIDLAISNNAKTLEVNLHETSVSDRVTWSLRGSCGDILPLLANAVCDE